MGSTLKAVIVFHDRRRYNSNLCRNGARQRCDRARLLRGRSAARRRRSAHSRRREAEAAFSIEKPWQSHGIGSALLERSLLAARNRGIKLLHVCCLVENQRMQQLARKFEAELTFDFGTVIGKMENPHPTPLSVMQEMVVDGHSFAAAYVDFQSRLLMPVGLSQRRATAS